MPALDTMPKVELHLHLEGAIPLTAMWELVEQSGTTEVADREALASRYRYTDFAHFIETWLWQTRFLDSHDAFTFAAEAVARDLAAQHIVYAEAFFSPSDFTRHGLTPAGIAMAIRTGLDRVPGTEVALIVDLVRDTGPEQAARTFDQVREVARDAGVIGIGIGGPEAESPPEAFADVYRKAAGLGFHLTAHAGEAAGPESVWGAIRELGVERIGHGIRSVEDPELVDHLVATQLPLEMCPTSNIRTGVVADWEHHPVRALVGAGARVTLNTDDPAMFGCSLSGEYALAADRFGFDDQALRALAENSVAASWAAPDTKTALTAALEAWWAPTGSEPRH